MARTPTIEGQETFTGRIMHSQEYRQPEDYFGLRIACLGAGPSGLDIALELSTCASQVRSGLESFGRVDHRASKKDTDKKIKRKLYVSGPN